MLAEKTAVLIDGPNLYATSKALGFNIDFKKLLSEIRSRCNLLRAKYYTAVDHDEEFSTITPLLDWLAYNGYSVETKPIKTFTDSEGRRKSKGNMDVELAVDAIELAVHVDHIVLFAGDGDFRSLVHAIQRRGVRVTVVSTIVCQPPLCADELRRAADAFIDLADLQPRICRDGGHRPREERQIAQFSSRNMPSTVAGTQLESAN
jgi:uncharacterized LabA/DUF88 family protein